MSKVPFAALLTSLVVSVAGTATSAVAIPWLVLSATGSAAATGLVAFAQMSIYVLAMMMAGPLVDRIGLRRAFVAGNSAAAVLVGAIPVIDAVGGGTHLPVLAALVACAGAIRGAADCANSALVPATAEYGGIALERAAGLNAGANRTAMLLGAPLGGVLVSLSGPMTAIGADALSFAAAAAIVAVWVRTATTPPADAPLASSGPDDTAPIAGVSALRRYFRDLGAGLRFLRGDRLLLGIVSMVAVTNLLEQGFAEVMMPVWIRQQIGTAGALGLLGAVGAAGGLAGNLLGAWLAPRIPRRALYGVGFLIGGGPRLFSLAVATTLAPAVAVFAVTEVFAGSLNSVIGATTYERIPEHLRARVLGVVRASAWIGIPFGALLAGYVVQAFGIRRAVAAFSAVYLVTTVAPFVFPAWRQMRRPTAAQVPATV